MTCRQMEYGSSDAVPRGITGTGTTCSWVFEWRVDGLCRSWTLGRDGAGVPVRGGWGRR